MARGALQVVGHGPVVLLVEPVLDQFGDQRSDAAKLRMPERIGRSRFGQKLPFGIL